MKLYQWYAGGDNSLTLQLSKEIVLCCHHQGNCDDDIEATIRNCPEVSKQLNAMDPAALARELGEYTDWDTTDPEQNKARVLWIACGDIKEEQGW